MAPEIEVENVHDVKVGEKLKVTRKHFTAYHKYACNNS